MSIDIAIIVNVGLAFCLVLAVGAMMLVPFALGRRADDANASPHQRPDG